MFIYIYIQYIFILVYRDSKICGKPNKTDPCSCHSLRAGTSHQGSSTKKKHLSYIIRFLWLLKITETELYIYI